MPRRRLRRLRRPQVALIVLIAALAIGYAINAARDSGSPHAPSTTTTVALSSLPPQVADSVRLIRAGGPYPYRQDGVVFDNAERHLPAEARGYYHEYTVPTPGSPDRGARRIIAGKGGEYYYTADHYETFVRVDVTR